MSSEGATAEDRVVCNRKSSHEGTARVEQSDLHARTEIPILPRTTAVAPRDPERMRGSPKVPSSIP